MILEILMCVSVCVGGVGGGRWEDVGLNQPEKENIIGLVTSVSPWHSRAT